MGINVDCKRAYFNDLNEPLIELLNTLKRLPHEAENRSDKRSFGHEL